MKSKLIFSFTAIVMAAMLVSCGKVPQAQIDAVNSALDSAKVLEADVYVPIEIAAVQDSMKAIMVEVEAQKSKLFRNFGTVEEKLADALDAANKVQADAVAAKDEVKNQVETLITGIRAVIDENTKLFPRAPRGKEGNAVLEQMKTEMTAVESAVTEAQSLYEKGAYKDAFDKVNAANDTAEKINTELKDAIRKVGGRI
jgi:hemerythrin-like domain-containing protein